MLTFLAGPALSITASLIQNSPLGHEKLCRASQHTASRMITLSCVLEEPFEFCFDFQLVLDSQFLDALLRRCWRSILQLVDVTQAKCSVLLEPLRHRGAF